VTTVQQTAARVRSAALTILDQLDTTMVTNGTPPGLGRTHGLPDRNEPARQAGELVAGAAEATVAPSDSSVETEPRVPIGTQAVSTTDGLGR
jgi:hypothetical protein